MYASYQPAPPSEWVYYLAVFRRALDAIWHYGEQRYPDGMLLGGYLADALHNVPAVLWHYEPGSWHDPDEMRRWVQNYPRYLQKMHAPVEITAAATVVVSLEETVRELGLEEDLSNWDLAPQDVQEKLLDMLYNSCLTMRGIMGFGRPSRQNGEYQPWHHLSRIWNDVAMEEGTFNGLLAQALRDIPCALVAAFMSMDSIPERYHDWWRITFNGEKDRQHE
jgi:hypothetical protein